MAASSTNQPADVPSAPQPHNQPPLQWYSWGSNASGLLAHGNTDDTHSPTLIAAPPFTCTVLSAAAVSSLACSGVYSLLCTADGELWHCGDTHQSCSLPVANAESRLLLIPARIALPKRIVSVACGWSHCGCISDEGELWMWGSNKHHQLGIPASDPTAALSFCRTPTLVPLPAPVLYVACGWRHTLALARSHQLLGWGDNKARQLSDAASPSTSSSSVALPLPLFVAALPAASHIASVHCGWRFSLLVASCGRVYCCGDNRRGQCGVSGGVAQVGQWTELAAVRAVRAAAVGWTHSLLLDERGEVHTFGRRSIGQAGTGRDRATDQSSAAATVTPERVTLPVDTRVLSIACGSESSLCIDSDGGLWSWGWNEHGNVGGTAAAAGEEKGIERAEIEQQVVWLPRRVQVGGLDGNVMMAVAGGASVFAAVVDASMVT